METIIKKAIEGGWNVQNARNHNDLIQDRMVCDIEFWQALGKACGWETICQSCGNPKEPHEYRHVYYPSNLDEICVDKAIRFHEINLTEGWDKAVEYLESLVV